MGSKLIKFADLQRKKQPVWLTGEGEASANEPCNHRSFQACGHAEPACCAVLLVTLLRAALQILHSYIFEAELLPS